MPITVWQSSPPQNPFLNLGADISFGQTENVFTGTIMHEDFLDFGSVSKGVVRSQIFCMFEIQEPVGTVFSSISYSLKFRQFSGQVVPLPFWLGFLAKDGLWNVQPEGFANGVGDYIVTSLFPNPTTETHSLWASGSASMSDSMPVSVFTRASFGSVGSGSLLEDDQLLTDFQAAFDANESDRTVNRGVPVFLFLMQSVGQNSFWRFESQNSTTFDDRPTLTLNTTPLDQGVIYDVIAKPSQVSVTAKLSQLVATKKVSSLDVIAKAAQIEATEKSSTLEVTAKPDTIDVTEA